MKTTISIIVLIALIIGGYFLLKHPSSKGMALTSQTSATSSAALATTTAANGKKVAFSQFMKQGGSYKCTVNQYLGAIGGPSTRGTVYLNNSMVRAQYSTTIQGTAIDANLIVRDGYSYMWTSMMPNNGFKMKAVVSDKPGTTAPASGNYSFNADQIGDYNCEAWTADAKLFVVPTTITFKEM